MRKEGDLDGLLLELQNPAALAHDDGVTMTVRERVPAQLRKLGAPGAVPALCKAMVEDDSPRVRGAAALALRKMRARSAASAFVQALADDESSVRNLAALGLAKVGDASATDALIEALGDESVWVRLSVAKALGRVGLPGALAPLKATARRDSRGHPIFRIRFARAIWRLRIRSALGGR